MNETPVKASTGSLKYLRDLAKDRAWSAKVAELPEAWQKVFSQIICGTNEVAQSDVSKFITLLKACDNTPKAKVVENPPTVDGIYAKGQKFFKVYWNNERNRLLAKEIVLIREAGNYCTACGNSDTEPLKSGESLKACLCDFQPLPAVSELAYRGVAERFVTADDQYQPTLEEALAFGPKYGRCGLCGRNLNDEISVKLGIGPVCGGREFGANFKTMHKMAKAELEGNGNGSQR